MQQCNLNHHVMAYPRRKFMQKAHNRVARGFSPPAPTPPLMKVRVAGVPARCYMMGDAGPLYICLFEKWL